MWPAMYRKLTRNLAVAAEGDKVFAVPPTFPPFAQQICPRKHDPINLLREPTKPSINN